MSQVIGQVWREVVGCRNWPVLRVPQFIALQRNEFYRQKSSVHFCWLIKYIIENYISYEAVIWDGVLKDRNIKNNVINFESKEPAL